MKKLFTLFLALVATTALWAEDFEVDGIYYKILNGSEVEVTYRGSYDYSYSNEYSGSVTIPSSVTYNGTTYSVTSIGNSAFYYCHGLTSVTIGNSVTSIGEMAFRGCSGLTSITIPNSVTSIGNSAFSYCEGLTSIVVNNGNTKYDSRENCNAIIETTTNTLISGCQNTIIPNSVTRIGDDAFAWCSGLTSITISNSVTSIGNSAFARCEGLTSVTIPNSVTSIGDLAFAYCYSLTSITIPNSVTTMGGAVFCGCSSLTSVMLSENMTSIKTYIDCPQESPFCYNFGFFEGCSSLTSITIPKSVTSIGIITFKYCSSLKSIIIPDNVTTLGEGLFYGCSSLESVVFSKNIQYIPSSHSDDSWEYFGFFGECHSLREITMMAQSPVTVSDGAFADIPNDIAVYVPCGMVSSYKEAKGWDYFTNIQEPLGEHSITVDVNDRIMGTAKVDYNTYCKGAQISATANHGYHFTQWNDGNTDNPRTLELTQDTTFTAEFAINQYSITTTPSHAERGTTQGDTTVNYLEYTTISATANYGYHFTQWNDGNTDNPRVVKVTDNTTYTAQFDKNIYTITTNCNNNQMGSVNAPNNAEYLDKVTITATATHGYHFVKWSDGKTDNPRKFVITQDTAFTAEFAQTFYGQCGNDLYWVYDAVSQTITITGSGDMYDYTKSTQPWSLFQGEITELVTSSTTTSIGKHAFEGCSKLGKASLGYSMDSIAEYAFAECRKLIHIYCYAVNPPYAYANSFANYNGYLYAPCENLKEYRIDAVFGSFNEERFECISSDKVNTDEDEVVVEPGTNDATISWPTEDEADTYSIVIYKDGEVFCTLTFNSNGQLESIAFAPGRRGNHPVRYAEATANGYRFTVTGLDESTGYGYNLDVKDDSSKTIKSYEGEFTTNSATGVEDVVISDGTTQKLIRNGQLLIIRDGKTYNAQGAAL